MMATSKKVLWRWDTEVRTLDVYQNDRLDEFVIPVAPKEVVVEEVRGGRRDDDLTDIIEELRSSDTFFAASLELFFLFGVVVVDENDEVAGGDFDPDGGVPDVEVILGVGASLDDDSYVIIVVFLLEFVEGLSFLFLGERVEGVVT